MMKVGDFVTATSSDEEGVQGIITSRDQDTVRILSLTHETHTCSPASVRVVADEKLLPHGLRFVHAWRSEHLVDE